MELALNLVWVAVSLVALLWWICGRERHSFTPGELFKGLVVLACVLVLLFPVISASDDLHANCAAIEDSFAAVRKMKGALLGGTPLPATLPVLLLLPSILVLPTLSNHNWVDYRAPHHATAALGQVRIVRSPPSSGR